jgi:hypothetical protein
MPREAALFDSTDGNLLIAYLTLREEGANIPPAWLDRSRESRKKREKELGRLLKASKLDAANYIREWELYYRKECFYRGLRALMELERHGKTKL